jgi:hypothetical protein
MFQSELPTYLQNIDLKSINDFEDPAIGAGILSQNDHMFNVKDQIEWLKKYTPDFTKGKKVVEALQVKLYRKTTNYDFTPCSLNAESRP